MFRVRTIFSGVIGSPYLNTSYWGPTPGAPGDAQLAVDRMRDFWTAMNAFMTSALTWSVSGQVDTIDALTGQLTGTTAVTARTGVGTNATDLLPGQVQGGLRLSSGTFIAGRRVQGHWFIPGPCEGQNTAAGVPLNTYTTALQNAATTMVGLSTPGLFVWSRKNGVAVTSLSATAQGKWFALRSRRD
jgi:hypothetical protein